MNTVSKHTSKANTTPTFSWRFLLPRYWGTWVLVLLLRVVMFLPRRWVMGLGCFAGNQFYKRNIKRRRIVEVNLALCFPELSELERAQMTKKHFQVYGQSLVDIGMFLWGSEKQVLDLVEVNGLEQHKVLVRDQKVLVVAWHQVSLEATANMMCLGGNAVAMMNSMSNMLLTWLFFRARTRFNTISLVVREQGLRPLLKKIKTVGRCLIIPDEDFGDRGGNTTFIPFFGVPRATLLMPAKLARSSGAKVVACTTRLDTDSGRYICTYSEPIALSPDQDDLVWMKEINETLERQIQLAPEQYMWTFRWFRSRPNGEPSPYDVVG